MDLIVNGPLWAGLFAMFAVLLMGIILGAVGEFIARRAYRRVFRINPLFRRDR